MKIGITKKLTELIGKEVDLAKSNSGYTILYNPNNINTLSKILRFESDDCVVFSHGKTETFLSIDHISSIIIMSK